MVVAFYHHSTIIHSTAAILMTFHWHYTAFYFHSTGIPLHSTSILLHSTGIPLHSTSILLHSTGTPLYSIFILLHSTGILLWHSNGILIRKVRLSKYGSLCNTITGRWRHKRSCHDWHSTAGKNGCPREGGSCPRTWTWTDTHTHTRTHTHRTTSVTLAHAYQGLITLPLSCTSSSLYSCIFYPHCTPVLYFI